jgi:hypothetical protein
VLACAGRLLRRAGQAEAIWLRFVTGRPVSAITLQCLDWCGPTLEALGVPGWALRWDNASWHGRKAVRGWIRAHNRVVQQQGPGVRVRILVCSLPVKRPWRNPMEPKWVHAKRAIVEPTRLLTAQAVADRVGAYHRCPHESHLSLPDPSLDKASRSCTSAGWSSSERVPSISALKPYGCYPPNWHDSRIDAPT